MNEQEALAYGPPYGPPFDELHDNRCIQTQPSEWYMETPEDEAQEETPHFVTYDQFQTFVKVTNDNMESIDNFAVDMDKHSEMTRFMVYALIVWVFAITVLIGAYVW